MTTGPIILARRWDGLGGRLHAIMNEWSAARALDLEFRFVWPRNAFGELQEPREVFDEAFVERFGITESSCPDCAHWSVLRGLNLLQAREHCLSGRDRQPVVVITDNDPYLGYLKSRYGMVRSPTDIVAGYAELTETQQAFADILLLSRARCLVAPGLSAFSRLASHLGGLEIAGVGRFMGEQDARRCLCEHIERFGKETALPEVLRTLLARDICWFLDVFSDSLSVGDCMVMAERAAGYDPGFCGALNRLAVVRARAGCHRAAEDASLRAQDLAARAVRHDDPQVESLAMSVSARVLGAGAHPCGKEWAPETQGGRPAGRIAEGGDSSEAVLESARRSLERCEALAPYQIHHADVLLNLRFQVAALAWLNAADDPLRAAAKEAIHCAEYDPLFLSAWRPSGFTILCAQGRFPQVLRNLEEVSILMALAIGKALSSASPVSRSPAFCCVDGVNISPSGLRWVFGWACDAKGAGAASAVGYACHGGIVSGGVTFLERPDVAAAMNDRRALTSGFAFPVPLAVEALAGDMRSSIRVQVAKRQRTPLRSGCVLARSGMAALSSRVLGFCRGIFGKSGR